MNSIVLRSARPSDYPIFTQLFLELQSNDPIPEENRFVNEIIPGALIAEIDHQVVGYAFLELIANTGYLRHLVVAASCRGAGVGRRLMAAAAEKLSAAGAMEWHLNVKTTNTPAIRLYESFQMHRLHETTKLKLPWSATNRLPLPPDAITASLISAEEFLNVETSMSLIQGQLADACNKENRVLMKLMDADRQIVGAAIFDPAFPGAMPFRLKRAHFVRTLLDALHGYAYKEYDFIYLAIEDDVPLRDLLVSVGAEPEYNLLRFKGTLPLR